MIRQRVPTRPGDDGELERYCKGCNDWFPATKEFFPSAGGPYLLALCKPCYEEKHQRNEYKRAWHRRKKHQITLSYPVSVNKMYIRAKGGGVILSPEASAWKEAAGWECIAQVGRLLLAGDIWLTVHFYALPGADIDNILKITQDALNGIAWEDDEQITQLHVYKYRNADNPRIELEIRGMKDV